MPRSPLVHLVRQRVSVNQEARRRGVELERVLEERRQLAVSRRHLLATGAKVSLLAGLGGWPGLVRATTDSSVTDIAIVGGGLAGLICAWRLQQAGLRATIYEASDHLGGRCQTRRNFFADGQTVERGGELIDTGHYAVRAGAGLVLDDLVAAEPPGTVPFFFFDSAPYPFEETARDFQVIDPQLRADLRDAGYPTLYNSYTARGRPLDRTSIAAYLEQIVPGGLGSRLGQLLDVACNIEYGAETNEQSSLNLLYLLGYPSKDELNLFGDSDERYRIHGGNDQLVSGLAAKLAGRVELGAELRALVRQPDGRIKMVLHQGTSTREVIADQVVLALPFSILRASVDLSRTEFSALNLKAVHGDTSAAGLRRHPG